MYLYVYTYVYISKKCSGGAARQRPPKINQISAPKACPGFVNVQIGMYQSALTWIEPRTHLCTVKNHELLKLFLFLVNAKWSTEVYRRIGLLLAGKDLYRLPTWLAERVCELRGSLHLTTKQYKELKSFDRALARA